MDEIRERYRRRADAFDTKVAAVRDEQWSDPSPCDGWDALGVVGHVVDMHVVMLPPLGDDAAGGIPTVQDDPLAAYRAARAAVEAVLEDPELSARKVDTPAGTMTMADQIDQVVSEDLVPHAWDLARATGQDDTMHPEDVELLWASLRAVPPELMEKYRTPGAFGPGIVVYGPEVEVADDAPLEHRVLGQLGRDPNWGVRGV